MGILRATSENILKAAESLRSGNIVAFPTETVYGLGADAFNPQAVAKVFAIKERPEFNPLILHINSIEQLKLVADCINPFFEKIINSFWPGPLTVVIPKKKIVPDIVTAGHQTVAVRMPSNRVALELIQKLGNPIAAPSANIFGRLSPTTAGHVEDQLGNRIEIILDDGPSEVGVESTIIELTDEKVFLLRHGGIPVEEVEAIVGEKIEQKISEENPNAPGQLKTHYSPSKPMMFIDELGEKDLSGKKLGGLFKTGITTDYNFTSAKILSKNSDPHEAAANLFIFLHEFEHEDIDMILCERIDDSGLWQAIMDRLEKGVSNFRT
ncbi:MAG: threonylcarbamoyl-AMP synthase [Melioribacteraceae bacterium]|nr:threonylcarbamoyl-AMP synthase [Melioribacteraceae bacterium]MCO6474635.1 threonylcarbamoyl-AMP synthase [Melioribacteraceae bacterium]MDD3557624.1 L-threonylcarbamoyladenylate synthase [Melioribacteraceae bacterium]